MNGTMRNWRYTVERVNFYETKLKELMAISTDNLTYDARDEIRAGIESLAKALRIAIDDAVSAEVEK